MQKTIIKISLLFIVLVNTFHLCYAEEQAPKYYLANWESPEWYQDAKFGIWTHWGVYSVPAYRGTHAAEWYPKWMYLVKDPSGKPFNDYDQQGAAIAAHHLETYGSPAEFGYHDFIPDFKAEKWDPDAWAQLGADCGAKFFTITGMHHDGFAMYDSKHTKWDSMNMGPKRDLTGDLAVAVRKKGLKFGISNHFAHNVHHYAYLFNNFKEIVKENPDLAGLYSNGKKDLAYVERWWNITTELVIKYSPDLYYFDWGWNTSFWDNERPEFGAFLYNHAIRKGMGKYGDPGVVLNYKNNSFAEGAAVNDIERGSKSSIQKHVWQTDTSISDHSWGYSTEDTFKTPKDLICMLVDIVSNNGVLMLNFGPKADGTVPAECESALLEMGAWLKVNGDAVYASRPWKLSSEGPTGKGGHGKNPVYTAKDIRYTQSKNRKTVYATAFGLPYGNLTLHLTKVLKVTKDAKITMLANGKNIPFEVNELKHLVLDLSKINEKNAGCKHAYSFAIEGIEMTGKKLYPIDLCDIYIRQIKDYDPLPCNFESQYPYLSSVEPIFVAAHNGVKRDHNYYGKAHLKINGKEYKRGLMVCPSGHGNLGIFIIKMGKMPKVKGITAEIGIDDAMTTAGNSAFIIEAYTNGKWQQLYKSKVLTYKDDAVKVDVKFPSDAEFIRLITTDGGNGCNADHAVWADAKFME